MKSEIHIACFVSAHGFGHAARACAVMEALQTAEPAVAFEIFTRVPRWFFDGSLKGPFTYHSALTDVGVVQSDALTEDLDKTVHHLDTFYPLAAETIAALALTVQNTGCRLVLCDIAPLGIAVARQAGIPSVLVENFTWDWIYSGYARLDARLERHVDYLAALFRTADYHIQTEPVCSRVNADMLTPPFSRKQRTSRAAMRERFGIAPDEPTAIITMGGNREEHAFLDKLRSLSAVRFLIPGMSRVLIREENLIIFPHHPDYYHPDLVNASDAAIGKVGYGTIAEVYAAGIPFGFVSRRMSPESEVLTDYVRRNLSGISITEEDFRNGTWTATLERLLDTPRMDRHRDDSAARVARFVLAVMRRRA